MEASKHVIRGRANVRTLAISAAVSLVGIVLVGLAAFLHWPEGLVWVGLGAAGVGIGLVISAQEAARKASVHAQLNDTGFLLSSNRTQFGLEWSDVKRVSMRANELIIRDKKGHEAKVVAPPGSEPGELDGLAAAMATRLDASRGYGGR